MKVLLDHCMPRGFRALLTTHQVSTTIYMGWSDLGNGLLLSAAAAAGFDCLLTVDRNVQFQQNRS